MTHEETKSLYYSSVRNVTEHISDYAVSPEKDFTREKKFPADKLIHFLVTEGSSSTKNELLDFFDMDANAPTASAFNQQRAKLRPEALEAVFRRFNSSVQPEADTSEYEFLAVDGSTFTFFSYPRFSPEEYHVSQGHSARGFYSVHVNALYDLTRRTYHDALLQPVRDKDEFRAFCQMVDRYEFATGRKCVFIGDRGYCSYNNMAHVINKGQFFLFRTKDIHSKGLVGNFELPDEESFDVRVKVTLARSRSEKIQPADGYKRFIDNDTAFDFVRHGTMDTYEMSFRVVRFPLSDSSYECVLTNLPEDEFPMGRIKQTYYLRWSIETSFRKLKYTIGACNFHAYKAEYVEQELWARLIAYNVTETLITHTALPQRKTKHVYKVNFSKAAHICRAFLRPGTKKGSIDVAKLLGRELTPIRDERQYARLMTAHFRKPKYFTYRPS